MRKTDEELRQHESPMKYLVAICGILVAWGALSALGLMDNLLRLIGH